MKDEIWMRVWNDGHPRFSADISHGVKWLAEPFRRLGEWIAPTSAPGTDSFFTRAAARCGVGTKRRAR